MSNVEKGPNGFPYVDNDGFRLGQWESGDFRLQVRRSDGESVIANMKPEQFSAFVEMVNHVSEQAENAGKSDQ